jgi:hypothetical protein
MALKPVAGRPVVPKNPGTGRSLSSPSIKPISPAKPQTPIKRRAAGQIKNPGNPIPTPRPVKPRTSTASTDPWKTGW